MAPPNERFENVNQIFGDALVLPPGEREGFVEGACSGNPDLKHSVMRLLSRFDILGDFLETPAGRADWHSGLQPGAVLASRFRILALLGRGGMGEVYQAEDTALGEQVALKAIRPEWREDPAMLTRFRDEIRLARAINHPNICNIHDLFTAEQDGESMVFFTMEFLDGETLASLLKRRGKRPAAEVLEIATHLAAGLDAAHGMGIIHRDLKPENIIVVEDPRRAVITDFGLARPEEPAAPSVTQTGAIVGSADYMAPEQFLGEPLTAAADIFAFGVVLFEMASGRLPFPREGIVRTAVRRLTGEPMPLRATAPDAPERWERTLGRALSRDPARRPPSAGALVKELRGETKLPLRLPVPSRRVFVGAGAACVSAALFAGFYRYRSQRSIQRPLLMLTPFTSATSPSDATALSVQIEKGLQQSERVSLFDRRRIASIWKLMYPDTSVPPALDARQTREIALRGGVNFILSGNLERNADEWVLKLSLDLMGNSPEHPQEQHSEHFYAKDPEQLLDAGAKAANWVRRTAGESSEDVVARSRPPQEVTTASWQALKEFSAGEEAWRAHAQTPNASADPRSTAEVHLRRALELDPGFALAAARLADIEMVWDQVSSAMVHYRRAVEIISRRNLTDRESLRISGLFAIDTDRFAQAEDIFTRYALEFPSDGLPLFYKASVVEAQGRPEEALNLYAQAIRKEPAVYSYRIDRAMTLLKMGRLDDADRECARASTLDDHGWTDQVRGALAFARRDARGVASSLERLRKAGSVPFQSKSFLLNACWQAERGRWSDAQSALDQGLLFDASTGQPAEARLGKQLAQAQILVLQGRRREAIESCRATLSESRDLRVVLDAGALLARAGAVPEARKSLPAAADRETWQWPGYRYRLDRLNAELALASGDARRAFAIMKDTRPPNLWLQWPECLVRAAVRAGERDVARAALHRLFANPGAYWLFADISGPGFMREAIEFAEELKMPSGEWSALKQFLNPS